MAELDSAKRTADAPVNHTANRSRRPHRLRRIAVVAAAVAVVGGLAAWLIPVRYAYTPADSKAANEQPGYPPIAFDVWGREISADEARTLSATPDGKALLSPANGAVPVNAQVLELGRTSYYDETYGNEVYLTDVLGMLDGPLTPTGFATAIAALGGNATTNLRVPLSKDAVVGGRPFRAGELVDTGLDVPRGALAIVGMRIEKTAAGVRSGITCAACHSAVDPQTGQVVHGAPNWDLNNGLLLAMATNSAAYFPHTNVHPRNLPSAAGRTVTASNGQALPLPDSKAMEDAVDAVLLNWPPGSFDSMIDLVAAPTKMPHAWTRDNWPYSFSGAFMAGPFKGLSSQTNNVHGLNSDTLTHADSAPALLGVDSEEYLAVSLQNAAAERFRFDPVKGGKPSEQLKQVKDPMPGLVQINEVVLLPNYPQASLVAPPGQLTSDPGFKVWEKVNAMAAWQHTLAPPPPPPPSPSAAAADAELVGRGRQVFARANCGSCHAGPSLGGQRVVRADEVGTQPLRAKSMARTQLIASKANPMFAFDQSVPLSAGARVIEVPYPPLGPEQVTLAMGWDNTPGGYKVPALVGLPWTAPYLHDGGVAVGPNAAADHGVGATLLKFQRPEPGNSLRALLDRDLRAKVVAANAADPRLKAVHVEGVGHSYWVDAAAGFGPDDQHALVVYLLSVKPGERPPG